MAKFVSAKRVRNYAQELYVLHQRREALRAELREVAEKEEFLESFLRRKHPKGFDFEGADGYQMNLTFKEFERRCLNQAKAKKLLGKKTPFSVIVVRTSDIDYVYEDE